MHTPLNLALGGRGQRVQDQPDSRTARTEEVLIFWNIQQTYQHPKVTRINPPTPTSHDLLILPVKNKCKYNYVCRKRFTTEMFNAQEKYSLVTKKCPSPATTDPSEPYRIDSRAHGMFSTSKIPRSLKGYDKMNKKKQSQTEHENRVILTSVPYLIYHFGGQFEYSAT